MACLILLVAIGGFPATGQEKTRLPTADPELIEGPWETTSASGIDGIFLTIMTGFHLATGSAWQTVDIRVYHRSGGKETWGYFATREKANAGSYALEDDRSVTLFDGSRLRIHSVGVTDLKPFDLDVTFSPDSREWQGSWSGLGGAPAVILRRPQTKPGVSPNPWVGDWTADPRNPHLASGSLHIRQSSDGVFSAWLDREVASSDQRHGEFLQVHSVTASELDLERPGNIGPSYRYHGSLSDSGERLTGEWAEHYGARLNAPERFRRMPDQPVADSTVR